MTLLAPISLATIAIVGAVCAGLLVLAYVLRMRRRRFEVPFSTLWSRVFREKEATTWWKHLRRILSLLLIAFILALAVFAATEPRLGSADKDARSVVIIIDASASMQALDAGEDAAESRISAAKERARDLLSAMGAGDSAMLMRMDGQTTPLSRFTTDKPSLKRSLQALTTTDTPANLRRALSAASDALFERQHPMIVIIGDGAYPEEVINAISLSAPEAVAPAKTSTSNDSTNNKFADKKLADINLAGIELRFIGVGTRSDNVGIVAFNVRRYISNKLSYEVFIEVQNFGDQPASRRLVLKNGDLAIDVKEIELAPGEKKRAIYPDRGGGDDNILVAKLEPPGSSENESSDENADVFPLDDTAYALLPNRKRLDVLLVSKDNLYLEGAMLVYDAVRVDKLLPEEYEAAISSGNLPSYSAVVFDDYTPTGLPPARTHLLYFNPNAEGSPFPITGTLPRPKVSSVNDDHPVMRWISMSDVNFDQSSKFVVNRSAGEVPLVNSISPIGAAKRNGKRKIVAFGFSLRATDFTLRVGFPLLLINTLDWFAGDDADLITTYTTGQRVRVPLDATAEITEVDVELPMRPGLARTMRKAPVQDSRASFYASRTGIHKMTARKDGAVVANLLLAANLANPSESNIAPISDLIVDGTTLTEPEGFAITRRQSVWRYMVLLILVLLGIEWYTYNRRITV